MATTPQPQPAAETARKPVSIRVVGVGSAGINVLEHIIRSGLAGVGTVAVNTDAQSLATSSAKDKIHLETKLLRGLGTGGDPDRGRAAAEENVAKLKSIGEGAEIVFILAGLGGGAGTGISPVLARAAKETGALVLGFVMTPFECEGARRERLAQLGLAELKSAADGVICLANQKVFKLIDENTSVLETFKITNDFLAEGVRGFWRLLTHTGLIDINFADLAALLRDRHTESAFAVSEAMGPTRSREVTDKLLAHPMLDSGQVLGEADAVLVSLMGGPDLTMADVNRVMEQINRHCEHAQIMMGAAIDENFRDRLAVTLIATRKDPEPRGRASTDSEELNQQLLDSTAPTRTHSSRFMPPPPNLPTEKREQLLARQGTGSRPRKGSSKWRQAQLQLDIVSKGRFDKSEPTIHKGEDLDVPTYIRRGIALN